MEILGLILLAFSPGILYVLALVVVAINESLFNPKCPQCCGRSLITTNFYKGTSLVDGRRAPHWGSYYLCKRCDAHLKQHCNEWVDVSEQEWEAYRRDK